MRYLRLIFSFFTSIILFAEEFDQTDIQTFINRTQAQFEKAYDYQVTMEISMKVRRHSYDCIAAA